MKFIKKKQIMFTVIGIAAILILTPMVLTSAKKDNADKKNSANHEISKNQVSKLHKSYIDIISEKTKGSKITNDSIKEIVPNVKLLEVDGYIPTGYNDNIDKELRAMEFKENNEKVSITYSYNQGIQEDITDIHYLDTNKKGYLNGIHAFYYLKDDELGAFETQIESVSVEDQEKIVNYIDNSSKEKEIYKMYYKFAKMAQESTEFPRDEFNKIPDNMKFNVGEKETSIQIDGIILTFMYDENMKNIYGVKLIDKNGNLLYTKSDIGNSMNALNPADNVSFTYIASESLEEQEKLLTKLNQNIQESTPRKTKDIENNYSE